MRRPQLRRLAAQASAGGPTATPLAPRPQNQLLVSAVEALFSFPPFFRIAAANVRACLQPLAKPAGLPPPLPVPDKAPSAHCFLDPASAPSPPASPLPGAPQARKMIVQRGERMGLDFQAEIEALKAVDWEREIQAVQDPSVQVGSRGGEVIRSRKRWWGAMAWPVLSWSTGACFLLVALWECLVVDC